MDGGIEPEILLLARFNTVSRLSFPMSMGIPPDNLFPMRSMIRRWGREVRHCGIRPEMAFQSATTRLVSRSRWQSEGWIEPVM